MFRKSLVVFCVCGMLFIAGCGSSSMKDAIQLTVGGDAATGALQAEDVQWYKATLEAGKDYKFVFKTDEARASVGVIFSVYLVKDEVQSLMWQRHYCPADFEQLTNENDCCSDCSTPYAYCEKQLAIDDFLAPEAGEYYISVEGYVYVEGNDQVNSYAYSDTLVYSVAVKYADTPFNPQGDDIPVRAQAAAVPYVTTLIEVYETAYHKVSLEQGKMYQVQKRRSDVVAGPAWLDQYGTELSAEMYFIAPYTGTFLLRMVGPGGTFGYAEYGLRVQQDDHILPGTQVPIGGTVSGYLGETDLDMFTINIPAKPAEQPLPTEYRVTVTNPEKFTLAGLVPHPDGNGYLIIQGLLDQTAHFSVIAKPDYAYLNNEPDGAGAYQISVAIIPAS